MPLLLAYDMAKTSFSHKPFQDIIQTCPCNVHPLTPHFYIVKLGFIGVYIIFLFLL